MLRLDDILVIDYLAESQEQLATVETDLLALEHDCNNVDQHRIDRLVRIMRTVRVGSSFIDLASVGELAQQVENTLLSIRSGKLLPSSACITTLLRATDRMIELIRNPLTNSHAESKELTAQLAQLSDNRQASTGSGKTNGGSQSGDRRRILLAEDDFACRLLLQTFLSRHGECHVAVNGKEAVEAFRVSLDQGSTYDLICMDIMMPELDGREAVRQIRNLEQARGISSTYGARIFMTTTVSEMRDVFQCFRELCDAYLLKPIDLGHLLDQMRRFQLVK